MHIVEDVTDATTAETAALVAYRAYLTSRRLAPETIRLRLFYTEKALDWMRSAQIPFLAVSTEQLEDYIFANLEWAQATQNSASATLKSFYKWAHRYYDAKHDPALDLIRIRVQRKPSRIASEESIALGMDVATTSERAMLLLGSECGLRVHEIAALSVPSRDGEWLHVVGKGGVRRSVWTSPELREALDTLESEQVRHGWYFPGKSSGHAHPSTVWRHVRTLTGTNTHSLRHRAGTVVYRGSGNNIRVTQQFLGHASPATTAIYIHVERDELRIAGEAARLGRKRVTDGQR